MIYNGVELKTLDPCFSIAAEIPPGGPGREVQQLEGQRGPVFVGVKPAGAQYRVDVNIIGKTHAEVYEKRTLLAAWATADDPKWLIPTWWNDRHYMAVMHSMSELSFQSWNVAVVTVLFDLFGGCALDNEPSAASGEESVAFTAGGNELFYPLVRITLANAAETVSLSLDGKEFFRLNGSFAAGNVLEIDFGALSLLWNGQHYEKLVEYPFSKWRPGFTPGEHTLSGPGTLAVEWRNAWQ